MTSSTPAPPVPGPPVFRRNQDGDHGCQQLVVGVHGMGDQSRNAFAQAIATLFAKHCVQTHGPANQATHLPIGLWDGESGPVQDDVIGFVPAEQRARWLDPFAFAEIHWADLPRELEVEGYRLQESTEWATTVVQRVTQRYGLGALYGENGPRLAATVIEQIAQTIRLLQRGLALVSLGRQSPLDLTTTLDRYLGDVQQVTEFKAARRRFVDRFLLRMEYLAGRCPEAEIHVIAHSEGSVLALHMLLTALRQETSRAPQGKTVDLGWIHRVRSFTTLGSPVDKHLILWPEIWYHFSSQTTWRNLEQRIRWRNYYDLADPVGGSLDTARRQLAHWRCEAFEFEPHHDHGFRRYPVPGKAHVDYFGDQPLFRSIIEDAVEAKPRPSTAGVVDRRTGKVSQSLPMVLAIALHCVAAAAIHRTLFATPSALASPPSLPTSIFGAIGFSLLLIGTTALARLPRLYRADHTQLAAIAMFVLGVIGFVTAFVSQNAPDGPTIWAVLVTLLAATAARHSDESRLRASLRPNQGLRWLLGVIGIAFAIAIPYRLFTTPAALAGSAAASLGGATLALFAWGFGILMFDLALCWSRFLHTKSPLLQEVERLASQERAPRE